MLKIDITEFCNFPAIFLVRYNEFILYFRDVQLFNASRKNCSQAKKPVVAGLTDSIDSIAGADINLKRINPTIIIAAIP